MEDDSFLFEGFNRNDFIGFESLHYKGEKDLHNLKKPLAIKKLQKIPKPCKVKRHEKKSNTNIKNNESSSLIACTNRIFDFKQNISSKENKNKIQQEFTAINEDLLQEYDLLVKEKYNCDSFFASMRLGEFFEIENLFEMYAKLRNNDIENNFQGFPHGTTIISKNFSHMLDENLDSQIVLRSQTNPNSDTKINAHNSRTINILDGNSKRQRFDSNAGMSSDPTLNIINKIYLASKKIVDNAGKNNSSNSNEISHCDDSFGHCNFQTSSNSIMSNHFKSLMCQTHDNHLDVRMMDSFKSCRKRLNESSESYLREIQYIGTYQANNPSYQKSTLQHHFSSSLVVNNSFGPMHRKSHVNHTFIQEIEDSSYRKLQIKNCLNKSLSDSQSELLIDLENITEQPSNPNSSQSYMNWEPNLFPRINSVKSIQNPNKRKHSFTNAGNSKRSCISIPVISIDGSKNLTSDSSLFDSDIETQVGSNIAEINENNENQDFKCMLCKHSFTSCQDLSKHMKQKHSKPFYECNLCDFKSILLAKLEEHSSQMHVMP